MFESAEIGHELRKSTFKRQEAKLRQRLLALQYRLLEKKSFPVLILVNGVDGAGKGETVNLLNEWMDPRHIRTHAFAEPSEYERRRPEMWRYWQALPPRGRIGILFGSWYSDPIVRRALGRTGRARFDRRLDRIRHFERMLVAEGALVIKLWFHLSKRAQKKRLEQLSARKATAWKVTREERKFFRRYDDFIAAAEVALRETSTGEAPWEIIEGSDHEYRSLAAGRIIEQAVEARLAAKPAVAPPPPPPAPPIDHKPLLASFDYTRKLSRSRYEKRLAKLQGRLAVQTRSRNMRSRALVLVFEGMDAAGKGSAIRRLTHAMDARFYRVIPVAAPTEEERAQPYLWRFWRNLPGHGQAAIFDRSWYGRVLVERVEGFCAEADWMRAFHEINEYEEQLVEAGGIVVKIWLAVTPAEQLRRFKARRSTAYKRFKITAEDWRNRKKWPAYEQAVNDMVDRTSTELAPWRIVASDDKLFARIEVLQTLVERLDQAL